MKLIAIAAFLLLSSPAFGQEIPKGVRYKRASEELNALARSKLESALASDKMPSEFFGSVTVIGPMLWKALRPSADKTLLDAKQVVLMVPGPGTMAEGKRILTEEERAAFWKLFHQQYGKSKDVKVRTANAEEISFYWATIPFDIDEPFLVIEAGRDRFVVDFTVTDGKPSVF